MFVTLSNYQKNYRPDPASAHTVDKISLDDSESRIIPGALHPLLFSVSAAFNTGALQPD